MLDDNWDRVAGSDAHHIELLNYDTQVNVIQSFVYSCLHRKASLGETVCPNENFLKELHRAGTLFLLENPGVYRAVPVSVQRIDGTLVYQPPHFSNVPGLMKKFIKDLSEMWDAASPQVAAAFGLWRINWIHPFKNGNGRSARAFAYATLCLKAGMVLPGTPTVIDLIMADKAPYEAALRHADQTFSDTKTPDLGPMASYIEALLMQQLSPTVTAALAASTGP